MKYSSFKRAEPVVAPDLTARAVGAVRVPYRYDADAVSRETMLRTPERTRTQQQFKEECDINNIAKQFGLTGRLPENVRMPTYGDFTFVDDYQSAVNAARWAEDSFMKMPANVRERFRNDPQLFIEFCSDERNRDEAAKLGLVPMPPVTPNVTAPPEPPKPVEGAD